MRNFVSGRTLPDVMAGDAVGDGATGWVAAPEEAATRPGRLVKRPERQTTGSTTRTSTVWRNRCPARAWCGNPSARGVEYVLNEASVQLRLIFHLEEVALEPEHDVYTTGHADLRDARTVETARAVFRCEATGARRR